MSLGSHREEITALPGGSGPAWSPMVGDTSIWPGGMVARRPKDQCCRGNDGRGVSPTIVGIQLARFHAVAFFTVFTVFTNSPCNGGDFGRSARRAFFWVDDSFLLFFGPIRNPGDW